MASLSELIYNIRNIHSGGILSHNDKISDLQIAFMIKGRRNSILRDRINKERKITWNTSQVLNKVTIERTSPNECPELALCETIFRTKTPFPELLDLTTVSPIVSITSPSGNIGFDFLFSARVKWKRFERYTSKLPLVFYKGGFLYFGNLKNINEAIVTIEAVFADPIEAATYDECKSIECYNWDDKYPIEEDMVPLLTKLISSEEMRGFFQYPQDSTNNMRDDNKTRER